MVIYVAMTFKSPTTSESTHLIRLSHSLIHLGFLHPPWERSKVQNYLKEVILEAVNKQHKFLDVLCQKLRQRRQLQTGRRRKWKRDRNTLVGPATRSGNVGKISSCGSMKTEGKIEQRGLSEGSLVTQVDRGDCKTKKQNQDQNQDSADRFSTR